MTLKKRIFVFEYTVGGGFYAEEITSSLLCEGYAMLRSIAEDFKNLGYKIITQIDQRILHLAKYLSVDQFYPVDSNNKFNDVFSRCIDMVDICFIIAPEFSNILYNLTRIAYDLNKTIISIGLEGIKLGASKIATYNYFKNNEVKTPKTFLIPSLNGKFDLNFIYTQFEKYNFPVIIKPDDGVGAESIYFFPDIDGVANFFANPYLDFDFNRKYILQEYIYGDDYSVSIINKPLKNNQKNVNTILSINSQKIKYKNCLGKALYEGGYTPVPRFNFLKKKLKKLLNKIDLSNFDGYLGIDFILTKENEIYFIEINPRLTTSYIGIRKIYSQNILSLLEQKYDSKCKSSLKRKGVSDFLRIDLKCKETLRFNGINDIIIPTLMTKIPELVTPPIGVNETDLSEGMNFSCFIATKCKNKLSSQKRILEIIKILENYFTIIK